MSAASKDLAAYAERLKRSQTAITRKMGAYAVQHFVGSFKRGGFTDSVFVPWKEVRRREVYSTVGGKKIYQHDDIDTWWKGKGSSYTYTAADRTRGILIQTGALRRSIRAGRVIEKNGFQIVISADKIYASRHNFGIKIPKRQFMGKSAQLDRRVRVMIIQEINKLGQGPKRIAK